MTLPVRPRRWPSSSADALLFGLYVGLTIYLVHGTGVVSDDFVDLARLRHAPWFQAFVPEGNLLNVPVFNTLRMIFYHLADLDRLSAIEIPKTVYVVVAFSMISRFFGLFAAPAPAMTAAFVFVFYPSHESTVYWLGGQYIPLSLAFYCYAYVQIRRGRLVAGALWAFLASFTSYSSPPVAWSLFVLCLAQGLRREAVVLIVPNVVYSVYYVIVSKFVVAGTSRLPDLWDPALLVKQFALQALSFIDAVAGPSFLLKVYFGVRQNTVESLLVGSAFIAACYLLMKRRPVASPTPPTSVNRALFGALVVLMIGNLVMFAVTGFYPQLAFNAGNRVTSLGTVLLAYVLIALPMPRPVRHAILGVMLFSIVGLAVHWKAWQGHQMEVITRIRRNPEVTAYRGPAPLYVTGNQYSRLGPFSHIEFLSEHWVVGSVFRLATHEGFMAEALNRRFTVENGELWDRKYQTRRRLPPEIGVYDSKADRLLWIAPRDLNAYLDTLPEERRHWVQMISNDRVRAWILHLMPRLRYAF